MISHADPRPNDRRRAPRRLLVLLVVGLVAAVAAALLVIPQAGSSPGRRLRATGAATSATPTTTETTTPPVTWVTSTVTLAYGGLARSYLITRPSATSTTKLPVLVVLHGRDVTPQFEEKRTDFVAVTGPAILVYPAGYDESWDAGACCGPAMAAGVDDIGFLTTVLSQVLRSQPDADPTRVYLAGYSNGGKMALTLACHDPGAFAAVGVYGATAVAACPAPGPVSLIEVASEGDPELTIGPGGQAKAAGTFVQPTVTGETATYRTTDGCPSTADVGTQGVLTETTWASCADRRRVALALYQGGSHTWPAGGAGTPSGARVIWSFFQSLGA